LYDGQETISLKTTQKTSGTGRKRGRMLERGAGRRHKETKTVWEEKMLVHIVSGRYHQGHIWLEPNNLRVTAILSRMKESLTRPWGWVFPPKHGLAGRKSIIDLSQP